MMTITKIIQRRHRDNYIVLSYIIRHYYGTAKQTMIDNIDMSQCNISIALVSLFERGHIDMRSLNDRSTLVKVMYIATEDGKKWKTNNKSKLNI